MSLLTALLVQVSCQLTKVGIYSFKERRGAWDYFLSAGGFPSSHTAFVTALTGSVAYYSGLGSDVTAVAAVFSIIVIYDSVRLRGEVERQAILLNKIRAEYYPEAPPLSERVGHTMPEVLGGLAYGLLVSLLVAELISI